LKPYEPAVASSASNLAATPGFGQKSVLSSKRPALGVLLGAKPNVATD
jgi:hypothetical protein